ncbi:MAG: CopG family transcriptional regulator [Verrucomicrobia bacterium]|nr:CopG family transcriptional regulator [Deltaproteobacteria bacterium]
MQAQLKPVGVKLTPELKDRLHNISTAKHRSPHFLMKEAILQYVEREEARERFNQETIESWETYQRDGQHITLNEMTAWLETWGTLEEMECPKCHK